MVTGRKLILNSGIPTERTISSFEVAKAALNQAASGNSSQIIIFKK